MRFVPRAYFFFLSLERESARGNKAGVGSGDFQGSQSLSRPSIFVRARRDTRAGV